MVSIPSHIIENELPKKFIDEYGTVDDYGDFEEIESHPEQDWYYVEWTNTGGKVMSTTFTQEQIVKKFVYLDLPEEGYNNQDFLRCLMRHYAMYLPPVNYLIYIMIEN